jgi:hypothetical protein
MIHAITAMLIALWVLLLVGREAARVLEVPSTSRAMVLTGRGLWLLFPVVALLLLSRFTLLVSA